jgi:hypothetical protein
MCSNNHLYEIKRKIISLLKNLTMTQAEEVQGT